jgi:hypothetical protein
MPSYNVRRGDTYFPKLPFPLKRKPGFPFSFFCPKRTTKFHIFLVAGFRPNGFPVA